MKFFFCLFLLHLLLLLLLIVVDFFFSVPGTRNSMKNWLQLSFVSLFLKLFFSAFDQIDINMWTSILPLFKLCMCSTINMHINSINKVFILHMTESGCFGYIFTNSNSILCRCFGCEDYRLWKITCDSLLTKKSIDIDHKYIDIDHKYIDIDRMNIERRKAKAIQKKKQMPNCFRPSYIKILDISLTFFFLLPNLRFHWLYLECLCLLRNHFYAIFISRFLSFYFRIAK